MSKPRCAVGIVLLEKPLFLKKSPRIDLGQRILFLGSIKCDQNKEKTFINSH
jgi:hypothetical protein